MYQELLTEFQGRRVVDYEDADCWEGSDVAYRVREEYADEVSSGERLQLLLQQRGCKQLTSLIVGAWSEACTGTDSSEIAKLLSDVAPQLPGLRHLFMGEMTYEESEISWIHQSNMSPLLQAYPKLESLRIRGGDKLSFAPVRHECLKELAIETGGLPRSVIRELCLCEFPNLEHLELLLGEENYGFDGSVEDLQPLLSGRLFPKLAWLGLMNSVIANDIAAVIVNSPLVERLKVLDLSMGNLDDEGVRSLMGLARHKQLQTVNISHHYASEETVAALVEALPCHVIAEDARDDEDEWRPILHAE